MIRTCLPVTVLACALLAGCTQSQIPVAVSYPYSEQQHMQAVQHWNVLATAQAEAISEKAASFTGPVYVKAADQDIPFADVYRQMLISQLIERDVKVTLSDTSPTVLSTHFRIVGHRAARELRSPKFERTRTAAGLAALGNAANHWSEPGLVLFPLLIASDLLDGRARGATATELAVTSQVVDFNNIVYSQSHTYYVNSADRQHYQQAASTLKLTDRP